MRIIRIFVVLSFLAVTLGGCSAIRGASSGAPGDAWYVRASTFSGKIKDIHYCPTEGSDCYEAQFVSTKELARLANDSTAGGEE